MIKIYKLIEITITFVNAEGDSFEFLITTIIRKDNTIYFHQEFLGGVLYESTWNNVVATLNKLYTAEVVGLMKMYGTPSLTRDEFIKQIAKELSGN